MLAMTQVIKQDLPTVTLRAMLIKTAMIQAMKRD